MGARVEWLSAPHTVLTVLAPGDDWIGAEHQAPDQHVLALSTDEVTAIEGTPEQLRSLLLQALAALPTPDTTTDAAQLLHEYDTWRDERADLSAAEGGLPFTDGPDPDEWHASDDKGCDLADRLAGALAAVTLDTASSASRQHRIDTGAYLTHADLAEYATPTA